MRIDNSLNRNASNAYQKKNKEKKEQNKSTKQYETADLFDLSSSIVILNQLLNEPEFQYNPLPFYFTDAANKNSQRASYIAKSIQQTAKTLDANLNYDMILDLVISHENENSKNRNTSFSGNINPSISYQQIKLTENETKYFETLHNRSIRADISAQTIAFIVIEYLQLKQNQKIKIESQTEQINLLKDVVKSSNNQYIAKQKLLLSRLINNPRI